MLNQTTKEYYQSRIERAIKEVEENKQALRGQDDTLLLLVEGVHTLAQMAGTLNNQARDKVSDAYVKRHDDIEEVRVLVSCILPKAYKDPFYLSSHPDVVIGLLMRGRLMGEYIDQIQTLPKARNPIYQTLVAFRTAHVRFMANC